MHFFKPKLPPSLQNAAIWVLGFLVSILYLFHFQNSNNDFQVFMKAGKYFLEKENSWRKFVDPNAMYLNGAAPLILSSILSLIPVKYGLLLVRTMNILVMLAASFIIGRKSPHLPVPGIFVLILLIFPFRSAMEYGQYTILFTFLAFLLLENLVGRRSDSLLAVSALALIVDFKPHIFMGLLIIILLHKRVELFFKAFCLWLIIQIIVGLWSHTIPIYEWFLAVKRRSNSVSQGEDNLSLTSHFGSAQFVLISFLSAIVIFYIWRHFRKFGVGRLATLEVVAISLILSPLLHPTDMLLVALILLTQGNFSKFHAVLVGLFLVWSPLPAGAIDRKSVV